MLEREDIQVLKDIIFNKENPFMSKIAKHVLIRNNRLNPIIITKEQSDEIFGSEV